MNTQITYNATSVFKLLIAISFLFRLYLQIDSVFKRKTTSNKIGMHYWYSGRPKVYNDLKLGFLHNELEIRNLQVRTQSRATVT